MGFRQTLNLILFNICIQIKQNITSRIRGDLYPWHYYLLEKLKKGHYTKQYFWDELTLSFKNKEHQSPPLAKLPQLKMHLMISFIKCKRTSIQIIVIRWNVALLLKEEVLILVYTGTYDHVMNLKLCFIFNPIKTLKISNIFGSIEIMFFLFIFAKNVIFKLISHSN